jgi:DNA polymerase-3 subunit epsilon
MNFTAIDFETANRYPTSACALGVVVVENGMITVSKNWLIKPEPLFFEFSFIHGITSETVENAKSFDGVWSEIRPYLEDNIVIAHNAEFDTNVLRRVLNYYDLAAPKFDYGCSVRIAKKVWKREFPKYGLKFLAEQMNIPLKHHDALSDTTACAKIMINAFEKTQTETFERLFEVIRYEKALKKFTRYS